MIRDDVKRWLKDDVTVEFFKYIHRSIQDGDAHVHAALANDAPNEAVKFNAGLVQLQEVLLFPDFILDDIKEKKDGEKTEDTK